MYFLNFESALLQQAGRCGRANQASLSIIICFDAAIDQVFG